MDVVLSVPTAAALGGIGDVACDAVDGGDEVNLTVIVGIGDVDAVERIVMVSVQLELVNPLCGRVHGIGILIGQAVVLEHGHVVVVADRVAHANVVRRGPEKPDVEILTVA